MLNGFEVFAPETIISEPAAFLIWALGLLGLIAWRKRRA